MNEYEILEENIKEIKTDIRNIRENDIKSIRERMHRNENNIASSAELLAETVTNLSWAISELEKLSTLRERIDTLNSEFRDEKEKRLSEIIVSKTSTINSIKDFVFSSKFITLIGWTIFLWMCFTQKFQFAENMFMGG